jgi:hypothetical protein
MRQRCCAFKKEPKNPSQSLGSLRFAGFLLKREGNRFEC